MGEWVEAHEEGTAAAATRRFYFSVGLLDGTLEQVLCNMFLNLLALSDKEACNNTAHELSVRLSLIASPGCIVLGEPTTAIDASPAARSRALPRHHSLYAHWMTHVAMSNVATRNVMTSDVATSITAALDQAADAHGISTSVCWVPCIGCGG